MSDRHEQIQRLLSDAHDDPTSVDASALAAARKHAKGCPHCRPFAAGLERIDAADRGQQAPAGLADRILAAAKAPAEPAAAPEAVAPKGASADEAAAAAAGADAGPAGPSDEHAGAARDDAPPSIAGHRRRSRLQVPKLAWGLAAAAAVAALFIGVRLVAVLGPQGGSLSLTAAPGGSASAPASRQEAAMSDSSAEKSGAQPTTGTGSSLARGSTAASASFAPTPHAVTEPMSGTAPKARPPEPGGAPTTGYVASSLTALPAPVLLSFDGDVWGFSGWLLGTPSTLLVQVGTVRASLGSTGGPVPRAVYERVGDTGERYIVWSGDDYQVYRPLSRVVDGLAYRMVTASPIRDWGVWPAWPRAAGTYPASSAGLKRIGLDQYGAPAFAEPGIPAAKGLALPPDLGGATPNPVPKWTWWRRVR